MWWDLGHEGSINQSGRASISRWFWQRSVQTLTLSIFKSFKLLSIASRMFCFLRGWPIDGAFVCITKFLGASCLLSATSLSGLDANQQGLQPMFFRYLHRCMRCRCSSHDASVECSEFPSVPQGWPNRNFQRHRWSVTFATVSRHFSNNSMSIEKPSKATLKVLTASCTIEVYIWSRKSHELQANSRYTDLGCWLCHVLNDRPQPRLTAAGTEI